MNKKPIMLNLSMYGRTNVMALRNKVAKVFNVHPMSFYVESFASIMKIKDFCKVDYVLERKRYSYFSEEVETFYLFEIDPCVFYSKFNLCIKEDEYDKANVNGDKDIEKCKEQFKYVNSFNYKNESNYNEDVNNDYLGLDKDKVLRVVIKHYNTDEKQLQLPRTLVLPKEMNVQDLYKYIFKYYYTIINDNTTTADNDDNTNTNTTYPSNEDIDKSFNELFNELITSTNDDVDLSSLQSLPFKLFIKKKVSYYTVSHYLPYTTTLTVKSIEEIYSEKRDNYLSVKLCIAWDDKYVNKLDTLTKTTSPFGKEDKDKELTIYDCFDIFVTEETLEEDNKWYCPKCKDHQCANKKIEIYNPPNILIVNFKRFNNMSKIDTLVDFPIEGLDIGKYVVNEDKKKESVYDLFAIGNHSGSLSFGHYYAYAKNHVKGKWFEFNDNSVFEIDESNRLVSSTAYVLFYRKRNSSKVNWEELYQQAFIEYGNAYKTEEEQQQQETNTNDNNEQHDDDGDVVESSEDKNTM
jgi:ubiquitin carboxyl-terminal hydrolase 4/11/15